MPVPKAVKPVLVTLVVIAIMALAVKLLLHENLQALIDALRHCSRTLIAMAVGAYFFSILVWAFRWRIALVSAGCKAPFASLGPIIMSTVFLNNMTPVMRFGGDPLGRVYLLQRTANTPYSATLAATIGEHAFAPLFTTLLLTGGLYLHLNQSSPVLSVLVIVAGGGIAAGFALGPRAFFRGRVGSKRIGRLLGILGRWVWKRTDRQRVMQGVETFYSGVQTTIDSWQKAVQIGGLTALIWALDIARLYLILVGLGHQPTLGMLLLASSLPTIAGLIPFLPGGLVIVEGSLVAVLVASGAPIEIAVAATIIERGISYLLSSIIGGIAFGFLGIRTAVYPAPQE